jgi:hypothetical protein
MENLTHSIPPESTDNDVIDEAMLEMSEFVAQMADVDGFLYDEEMLASMQMERVDLSIPMQLDLHVMEDGTVKLGGSPPLYYTETTILPVFHQFSIKIKLTENSDSHAGSRK